MAGNWAAIAAFASAAVASVSLASPAAAASPPDMCAEHPNTLCYGNDINPNVTDHPKTETAAACCRVCQATRGCVAWTWNGPAGNHFCYAKTLCQPKAKTGNTTTSGTGAPLPTPAPPPTPFS